MQGEIQIAAMSCDHAITFTLHIHKTLPKDLVHIQCATLYTSDIGQRRVRVLNLSLPVSTLVGNIFRFADVETCATVWLRGAILDSRFKSLEKVQQKLTKQCISLLLAYRSHCAQSTPISQVTKFRDNCCQHLPDTSLIPGL